MILGPGKANKGKKLEAEAFKFYGVYELELDSKN